MALEAGHERFPGSGRRQRRVLSGRSSSGSGPVSASSEPSWTSPAGRGSGIGYGTAAADDGRASGISAAVEGSAAVGACVSAGGLWPTCASASSGPGSPGRGEPQASQKLWLGGLKDAQAGQATSKTTERPQAPQ